MNTIDEWIDSDIAHKDALKFKNGGHRCGKTAFAVSQIEQYLKDHPDAKIAIPYYHNGHYYYKELINSVYGRRKSRHDDMLDAVSEAIDEFDWEKGLAMAYVKRAFNNERTYYGLFKKNEPFMNLPNSNMRYDPKVSKEVRIIVPKDLPVTSDIIMKAHELIMKEGDKKWENGISLGQ